jgi:DNA-binding phage protein
MNNVANMFPETKPDLVTLLLQQVIAMSPGFSEAVYKDGLTAMGTDEIKAKHGVSRPTIYRIMKQGGRFGS